MLDATLRDLVLYVHRHFMLHSKTFYFTCAETWWSLKGSSLVLAQTLGATLIDILLFSHRHLWLQDLLLYLHACTDVSFGATLKDLPWYLHRHLMLRYRVLGKRGAILSGAGTGPETGTIHVYIYLYAHRHRCKWFIFVYKQRRFCFFARSNKPRQ